MPLSLTGSIQTIRAIARGSLDDLGYFLEGVLRREHQGIRTALTASAAVPAGTTVIELNHATVAIAATIADFKNHIGLLAVVNTSASGTAAHTVTIGTGTWNGTNTVATLNAPGKALLIHVDQYGVGTVVLNSGTVTFS